VARGGEEPGRINTNTSRNREGIKFDPLIILYMLLSWYYILLLTRPFYLRMFMLRKHRRHFPVVSYVSPAES